MRVSILKSLPVAAVFLFAAGCDSNAITDTLPAPSLQGPADGESFRARSFVEFSWSPVDGAGSYQVSFEYQDYPDADTIVTTLVPLTVHELAEIGSVDWRVRGISSDGDGLWSQSRTVISVPSEVHGTWESPFIFSSSGLEVGKEIFVASGLTFAPAVLSPVVDFNGRQRDIRDIVISNYRIVITDPPGTVMDQFSNWRVTAGPPEGEHTILALTEPAPAVDSLDTSDFIRPANWISLALDNATMIGIKADVNPRTPKESDIGWRLSIQFTVLLNR